jgi:hypothetical protein
MDTTDNLGLPYIAAAQAQKHVTHNEALRALDALVHLAVLDKDLSAPPAPPAAGARYIVGPGPTGAWAGQAGCIAAWQDGAWAFHAPHEGWLAWIADEGRLYAWRTSAWAPLPTVFDTAAGILDGAGHAQLIFHATPGAANHLAITNAASGTSSTLSAEGTDANVDLHLAPKGTGMVRSAGQVAVSSGAYPPLSAERTTSNTSTPLSPQRLLATTSGDMADGFGAILGFSLRDNSGVTNEGIATVRALRSGADNSGRLQFTTLNAGIDIIGQEIAPTGSTYFPSVGTTASAANAVLNSGSVPANELMRSTSSKRYKREIEEIDDRYADNVLKLRPVWYRSTIATDRQDWSHYGLIAEEVADVDPRLVHWGYSEQDWATVQINNEGDPPLTLRHLRQEARPSPDGVAYDRLAVLLLSVVRRQQHRLEECEAKANRALTLVHQLTANMREGLECPTPHPAS